MPTSFPTEPDSERKSVIECGMWNVETEDIRDNLKYSTEESHEVRPPGRWPQRLRAGTACFPLRRGHTVTCTPYSCPIKDILELFS